MPITHGEQRPRVLSAPPNVGTLGREAIEFGEGIGIRLDPWQQTSVNVALSLAPGGRWAAFEFAALVARQNGKGGISEVIELADLFLFQAKLILHSAHQMKTANEAFGRVVALIENYDDLRKRVKQIHYSKGAEGIYLLNGRRLLFHARSGSSGRGFSGDRVWLDEAQELPSAGINAAIPTLSARPNPQVCYTGTVPDRDMQCDHWTSLRDRGRAMDPDESLAWMEWTPDEDFEPTPKTQPMTEADWNALVDSNPALGYRITVQAAMNERRAMSDDGYARERLSHWPSSKGSSLIEPARWNKMIGGFAARQGPMVLAVDVDKEHSCSAVSVAFRTPDGVPMVEVMDARPGVDWVSEFVEDKVSRYPIQAVVLDPASGAGALLTELEAEGSATMKRLGGVQRLNGVEVAQACGAFFDDAMASPKGRFRHPGQSALNEALKQAKRKFTGKSFTWIVRGETGDITPLYSVTLALHGLKKWGVSGESKYEKQGFRVLGGAQG